LKEIEFTGEIARLEFEVYVAALIGGDISKEISMKLLTGLNSPAETFKEEFLSKIHLE
jgi:hypothetical protein